MTATTTNLDDVLKRARERCLIADTKEPLENQTHNSGTGNPNPTKTASIDDCIEKAIGYGLQPPEFQGSIRPPLETYTTQAEERGVVYRATDQYVLWYRSTYGFDKTPDRSGTRSSGGLNQEVGRKAD